MKIVYVLPPSIVLELEHKKNTKNDNDTQRKARLAINAYNQLTEKGAIRKGIQVENCSWFITTGEPDRNIIQPELEKLSSIKASFHETDTKMLILAKEIKAKITTATTVFITEDKNLHNLFLNQGMLSLYVVCESGALSPFQVMDTYWRLSCSLATLL